MMTNVVRTCGTKCVTTPITTTATTPVVMPIATPGFEDTQIGENKRTKRKQFESFINPKTNKEHLNIY